ncbi:MAG: hypothetical protein AB7D34_04480 [Sulfurimonas sp.]
MSNQVEIKARIYLEDKKYIQAVEVGLAQLNVVEVRTQEEFTKLFLNLAYSLYAASEINLYNEFLKIFDCYIGIITKNPELEPPIGFHNHACLMQHNLMATLFKYYDAGGDLEEIKKAIDLLKFWTSKVPEQSKFEDVNSKLLKLSNLIFESKPPYYVVEFRLPLALPLPDGKYNIRTIGNVMSIEIENRKYENITSIVGDRYFSSLKLKVKGFTCTNNYWNGPSLSDNDAPYNLNICIKAVNEILLAIKLTREDFRLKTISHQDIGKSITNQFNGDGESFHTTINLGFGGDALVDVLSKQELNEDDIQVLINKLKTSKLEIHEELFSEALMEQSNDNTTGAFYLLNSSCESLIQKYVYLAAEENNKVSEYEQFMTGKSFCSDCDLFKNASGGLEPPRKAMPPSLFSQLKFFKEIGLSTSSDLKEMRRFLFKIRNDDLRNSLIHGRINHIPRSTLNEAFENYKALKKILSTLISITA